MAKKNKKEEFIYVDKIVSYQCTSNEIWLGVEVTNDKTFETERKHIIFSALDVLNSGITDKEYIKKSIIKFVNKL
tara:strand:+ start:9171 stop:9395 length:225 start_codon:yes stop_codon:yes gene_type:complete